VGFKGCEEGFVTEPFSGSLESMYLERKRIRPAAPPGAGAVSYILSSAVTIRKRRGGQISLPRAQLKGRIRERHGTPPIFTKHPRGGSLKIYKYLFLVVFAAFVLASSPPKLHAQIAVQIGPPPVCPYGYFDYPPYDCAPYGYYGPEWFPGGIFIGAGPWYHGRERFWGHVDNHFDRHDGYRGEYPHRGEHFDEHRRPGRIENFRGNESRDGHGRSNLGGGHEHGDHDRDHDRH